MLQKRRIERPRNGPKRPGVEKLLLLDPPGGCFFNFFAYGEKCVISIEYNVFRASRAPEMHHFGDLENTVFWIIQKIVFLRFFGGSLSRPSLRGSILRPPKTSRGPIGFSESPKMGPARPFFLKDDLELCSPGIHLSQRLNLEPFWHHFGSFCELFVIILASFWDPLW